MNWHVTGLAAEAAGVEVSTPSSTRYWRFVQPLVDALRMSSDQGWPD